MHFQKTLQKYCSGKQVKEGWVLAVPFDTKHGVGTPYLKPADVSSSSKGHKTIKRYYTCTIHVCRSIQFVGKKLARRDFIAVEPFSIMTMD